MINNDFVDKINNRMQSIIELLENQFMSIRTNKIDINLFNNIMVDYHGSKISIKSISNISILDLNRISIIPWDISFLSNIANAIKSSNLGFNPINMSDKLIVPIPMLTEDRRKMLVKKVKSESEKSKIIIRNIRRDFNNILKKDLKEKKISLDDLKKTEQIIQNITNSNVNKINVMTLNKEKRLMMI